MRIYQVDAGSTLNTLRFEYKIYYTRNNSLRALGGARPCSQVEGTSKMQKSVFVNIDDVCKAIGRPPLYLVTFFGQNLGVNAKIDKDGKAYIAGAFSESTVQELVFTFLRDYVRCHRGQTGHCNNIETTCVVEGSKKSKKLFLNCKSCGASTNIPNEDRFAKFMLAHPFPSTAFGQAPGAEGSVGAVVAELSAAADAAAATAAAAMNEKKKRGRGGAGSHGDDHDSWDDDWSDKES